MISAIDFRSCLVELLDYETNPINKARVRRALRNDRVFDRWLDRVSGMASNNAEAVAFDFDTLFEWLTEHWDEILRILVTLLPLFL